MPAIVHTVDIERPPGEVFAYVTDPTRFAEWQDDVVSVRMEDGPSGVGAKFTTTRRIGPAERTMTQQVTADSPPARWASRGIAGPVRPSAGVVVEPLRDGAASRVTFTLDFEGHGIGVPLIPAIRRMAAKGAPDSFRNVKNLLEKEA